MKSFVTPVAGRAIDIADLGRQLPGVVIGDLSSAVETRKVAEQVNAMGKIDAVIHNTGIYRVPSRSATHEGHARLWR